jgi:PAS domain S-box-containing protein
VDAEDKILHYNRFTAEITGYPLAETRGKDWAEVFLPESERARARSLLERCAPGSAGGDNLLPFLTKRGQRRVFSWGGRILRKEDGAPIGTLYVGQDITPLIEAQEKAVRSGRLAAMGQTIAALSHEVRNELLGLRFILRSLDKRMVDDVTRGLVARLRDVESRLSRMFEDLRGFAAPIRLERSPASVADAWRSAWASLKHKHGDDAELIEQTAEADLHCPIDPLRVEQVFRNLFENSLAASPPPVRLVVTCSEVSDADKRMLRVSVRDNGPGLPPEVRDRVFEPFFTTKSEGTGLGMPICRRIIEEHGGELRVGEPGPGAEFVILLPKAEAPRSAAPSPHSTATARANGRSGER